MTVTIQPDSTKTVRVNQKPGNNEGVVSLGKFELPAGNRTSVRLSNEGTDGYVVADGVQFLPVTEAKSRGDARR